MAIKKTRKGEGVGENGQKASICRVVCADKALSRHSLCRVELNGIKLSALSVPLLVSPFRVSVCLIFCFAADQRMTGLITDDADAAAFTRRMQ
jgi:hypothetical protein